MEKIMKSIIQIALETETRGYEYFKSLAEKCNYNVGVKTILEMLAKEQQKQIKLLKQWEDKTDIEYGSSAFFEDSRHILQDLQSKIDEFSCSIDHLALYEHAKELQEKALQNYQNAKSEIHNEHFVGFLGQLIAQKQKQIILLDNIIELLLRPEQWVESSEFTKLDDY